MQKMRDGYKVTEIGEIPVSWEVRTIGEVSSFCSNGFVGTASPYYTDETDGTPYLMSNNVRANKIDTRSLVKINEEFVEMYPRTKIYRNDMLTVQSGHIGTSCVVTEEYDNANCHALIITRPNANMVNSTYMAYYVNSSHGKRRLSNIFVGTTIKHINVKDFVKFSIPIPPLVEQEKIANILSTVDQQIEQTDALIEKTKKLKKGLMQRLLTKGIGHTEFRDTEIGRIPKGWEVVKLDELSEVITKGTTPSTYGYSFENSGVNFIKIENLKDNGFIDSESLPHISEECNEKLKRSQMFDQDIIFSIAGSLGKVAIISKDILPANTNQALAIIRLKKNIKRKYVYYYLQSERIERYIKDISTVGAQPNLSLKQVANINLIIPSEEEQEKIIYIFEKIDAQICQQEKRHQSYMNIKSGLMQLLLTGKLRVPVDRW